jgi:antiviral helicase SKI2
LQELKLALSDQNLELLPDYEQRVAVLKELQYIDETSTVLLKGRVACEASRLLVSLIRDILLTNICTATDQLIK